MIGSVTLGAPGVYELPGARTRTLTGVRMDVAAFVGVSPRGPARERPVSSPWLEPGGPGERDVRPTVPVPVESWEAYVRLFGGFEGPGRLPYAVHAFFRQGGRRAWVARVVHRYGDVRDLEGVAWGSLPGIRSEGRRGLRVRARVPGEAGRGIRADLEWSLLPLTLHAAGRTTVELDPSSPVETGALLRATLPGGGIRLVFVSSVHTSESGGGPVLVAALGEELPEAPATVERVEATVDVEAPDGTTERHEHLALSPEHPRWLAAVLEEGSGLVGPDPRWRGRPLLPLDPELPDPTPAGELMGGRAGLPAVGRIPGLEPAGEGLWLRARNEGSWGNRLRADLSFSRTPVVARLRSPSSLEVGARAAPGPGALLRARLEDGTEILTYVVDSVEEWAPHGRTRVRVLALDRSLSSPLRSLELVEAELRVFEESAPDRTGPIRSERFGALGLSPAHPRWIHRVVARDSELVHADPEWSARRLDIDRGLPLTGRAVAASFGGGTDRFHEVVPADFFDPDWHPTDEGPGAGVHALVDIEEAALLAVPDLYSPEPVVPVESVVRPPSLAGPEFAPCVVLPPAPEQATPTRDLEGLRLDPDDPSEREEILRLQKRLESLAEARRAFVVLLDVPPGLDREQILRWRARFRSEFAAAYHPWLRVRVEEDRRDTPVLVNPAAVAAGIVARQEILFGVHHGPANAIAGGVVDVEEDVSRASHDILHPAGVNVFLRERDGVRLLGARTLASRSSYRQLSVRRLVTMVARTLERRMQWAVFEPNDARLRSQMTHLLTGFMRELYGAGALSGATEEEAFFVRCDQTLNPRRVVDAGRLVAEVGLAPAEPVEFLVLRIVRSPEGDLRVEG